MYEEGGKGSVATADGGCGGTSRRGEKEKTDAGKCQVSLKVDKPHLYSPESPRQYRAFLKLYSGSGTRVSQGGVPSVSHQGVLLQSQIRGRVLDVVELKLGFKHLEKRVCRLPNPPPGDDPQQRTPHPTSWGCFFLNNQPLYLPGYGDDSIYPETLSAPVDRNFYRPRVKKMRALGFNYVRHHSHFLPAEYFDAACEVGLFVAPEGHIAYNGLQADDICGPDADSERGKACDAMALR